LAVNIFWPGRIRCHGRWVNNNFSRHRNKRVYMICSQFVRDVSCNPRSDTFMQIRFAGDRFYYFNLITDKEKSYAKLFSIKEA
jgi:hypothetical protein